MLTFLRSKSRRTKTAKNLAYRLKKTQLVRHGIQEALTFSFTQRSVFIFLLAVQSKTPGWRFQIGKHFWKAMFPVHTAGFVWLVGNILETDAFVAPIHLKEFKRCNDSIFQFVCCLMSFQPERSHKKGSLEKKKKRGRVYIAHGGSTHHFLTFPLPICCPHPHQPLFYYFFQLALQCTTGLR